MTAGNDAAGQLGRDQTAISNALNEGKSAEEIKALTAQKDANQDRVDTAEEGRFETMQELQAQAQVMASLTNIAQNVVTTLGASLNTVTRKH